MSRKQFSGLISSRNGSLGIVEMTNGVLATAVEVAVSDIILDRIDEHRVRVLQRSLKQIAFSDRVR